MMNKNRIIVITFSYLLIALNVNCQTWSSVGTGVISSVADFAVDSINNELYVGGSFLTAGGINAPYIAKWNGIAWSDVGGGMNNNALTVVISLCFFNGELYAAGSFDSAGGVPAKNIAKWNGANWSAVGAGINGQVYTLAVYNGELYAGGFIDSAGSSSAHNIAKWDGSNWADVGGGTDYWVLTLCTFNNELFVGGGFFSAGGTTAYRVAKWNGLNWDSVGVGFNNTVNKLFVHNNQLYAGGEFTPVPGNNSRLISKWNGNAWQPLPSPSGGNNPAIRDLTSYNGSLYVTGEFTSPSYIAKFNGNNYAALGSGLSWVGECLIVFNNELYIGGYFSSAGGMPNTSGLAKWNDAVGVFENVLLDHSIAAPNPFSQYTIFKLPENLSSKPPYQLIIYSAFGKMIKEISDIKENVYKMERGKFPSGIYLYQWWDNSGKIIATGKVIAN